MSHDHFCTPRNVSDMLWRFYDKRPVGLDPATNEHSIIRARRKFFAGALQLPWDATTIWENPPYSAIEPFTDHGILQLVKPKSKIREWIRLVPAATSTAWFRKTAGVEPVIVKGIEIYAPPPLALFTKRLKFIDPYAKTKESAMFDTVLFYFGKRRERFIKAFESITSWVSPGRSPSGRRR